MAQTSDFIVRHYLNIDDDSGYYSSSTSTSTSMPSLVSIVSSSSGVSGLFPNTPSTPSRNTSGISTSGTRSSAAVTAQDIIARHTITWAPLPEEPSDSVTEFFKQLQSRSSTQLQSSGKTQQQSQPKAVSRVHNNPLKPALSSRTKARIPAKTTSKIQNILAILENGSETTPTRATRRTWKQHVQPVPQHQRQSNLTALIQDNKARPTACCARKDVAQRWAAITACSYGELRQSDGNRKAEIDEGDISVSTAATSSPINIPLDPWGQPNNHLAAKTTWMDGWGTQYLADGTKAELTVNSFGERMPVEIATWGDYWGTYTLRYEEDEDAGDWDGDLRVW